MSEIIQKWLQKRLGVIIDTSSESFVEILRDGVLLAQLLRSYDIINYDQLNSVVPTDEICLAESNFKNHIYLWLKPLGIQFSDNLASNLYAGRRNVAIRLLYQLYLALHDKDKISIVAQQITKEKLGPLDSKFEVVPIPENIPSTSTPFHPLCTSLCTHDYVIEWHKYRYDTLVQRCKEARENYLTRIRENFGKIDAKNFNRVKTIVSTCQEEIEDVTVADAESSEDYSYKQLLEEQAKAQKIHFQPDTKTARKIVNKIKKKRSKNFEENALKVEMNKLLLMELWEHLISRQEQEFENEVSRKMLKQSSYEKQIASKLFEVREQKQKMLENRQMVDQETQKKRDEEFLNQVFLRQKSIEDQKYSYYFERDRALELHQRLYAEKLRLRAERHYNFCKQAAYDIIDVALRHAEYREKYEEEVPARVRTEWSNLFIKEQPIFDILDNIEDIVEDYTELPEKTEDEYNSEIARQNALDEKDFEAYTKCEWPWDVEDLLSDFEDPCDLIELGMNVLGYIVHRILFTKYPKPIISPPNNLPTATIAVCVNGITDITILPILQQLLTEKGVKLVQVEDAINYCLESYKNETQMEYIDTAIMEETENTLNKTKGKQDKNAKPKKGEKANGKKRKRESAKSLPLTAFSDQQCQTPRIYPCEEIALTKRAEFGKTAYELLNLGEQLSDEIIIAMLGEYLQSLADISGWALINYPISFKQAAMLEEYLTGKPVPVTCKGDETEEDEVSINAYIECECREVNVDFLADKYKALRVSKILSNPDPPLREPYYDTYLTAYVHLKPFVEDPKADEPAKSEFESIEDPLEHFYMDQGCYYMLFYKTYEFETIKHLAKLIIGEYTIPPKTSIELFGDTVTYVEANLGEFGMTPGKESQSKKTGEKKAPPKQKEKSVDTAVPEEQKGKKGKKAEVVVVILRADKEVQVPEPEEETEEILNEPVPEPKPGETGWIYINVSIPEALETTIATMWESTEEIYVSDFKQLFFIKRIILNAVIPYLAQVKNHMRAFITRPDNKQTHLHEFQTIYNEIDADMRDDYELKAEIHCRISEFREKMWEICDTRMKDSEKERQRIIKENWVAVQVYELVNNYMTAMQLEIDRCVDSLQLLTDYYTASITKMPSGEPILAKILLDKIQLGNTLDPPPECKPYIEVIDNLMTKPHAQLTKTVFHEKIEENYNRCVKAMKDYQLKCSTAINTMDSIFRPKVKGKGVAKDKKGSTKSDKSAKKLPKFLEPEPDVKEAASSLIEEWTCAVNGEIMRVNFRLSLIAAMAGKSFKGLIDSTTETFHDIYDDILGRYEREMKSVHTACELISRAVEAEVPIQPLLMFSGDSFYIDPDVILFPNALIPPEPPVREHEKEGVFTMEQLNTFTDILLDLAPNGSIPERAFVFLLQDMIVLNAEDGRGPMVPELWTKLQPNQVSRLSYHIFGDVEFVEWKDFIIYNLCVRFPTEEELLCIRHYFRENDPDSTEFVKDYQFFQIKFWFEDEFDNDDVYRLTLLKQQLFKLYKINDDTLNYTALLLSFCKDDNPIVGFAKALELSLGKLVCWNKVTGDSYVESIMYTRYRDDINGIVNDVTHAAATCGVQSFMRSLVGTTVHACDSVVIDDHEEKSSTEVSQVGMQEENIKNTTEIFASTESINKNSSSESNENNATVSDSIITEGKFSNVEIGFETNENPPKSYFLPFEVLLTVLTACLPWHAQVQNFHDESYRETFEDVYNTLKNPDFQDAVFTHEFLNNAIFKEMLARNFKFFAKCIPDIVTKLVYGHENAK